MTAVVLIAVMVDRRAVTFRTLAVTAMIVLPILLYPVSRVVWLGADLALRPHSEKSAGEQRR